VSNILVVESENDKFFIEALVNHINIKLNVETPICSIDDYECIGGIGELKKRLKEIQARVKKEAIDKLGIIVDADKKGVSQREKEVLDIFKEVFSDEPIDCSIYIINKDGYGELEDILLEIKSKNSSIADCLDAFQDCLPDDKKLNQKEINKLKINFYQRYDCCSKIEKKQAGKKCNNEVSLKNKEIYNFDHEILDDLKEFLKRLGESNDNTTSD